MSADQFSSMWTFLVLSAVQIYFEITFDYKGEKKKPICKCFCLEVYHQNKSSIHLCPFETGGYFLFLI